MKTKIVIIAACLLVVTTLKSQNFEWAKSFGSTYSDIGTSICVDASGNVYTTGVFKETVDFDPGTGTNFLTSVGLSDIFAQKLDASGNFLWAKSFGGISEDISNAIFIDTSGNIYTTGYFYESVDFDPGVGTTTLTSEGINDIFVQKMDTFGNFLWAKSFGSTSFDGGNSICTDNSGNVYTTGDFHGTVDFDPDTGTTILTSIGGKDIFVQKMDANGNFLWAKSFGGTDYDYANSISIDTSGNVYTTGVFKETVDFDPGAGTTYLTSEGYSDIFVQKMDASGNFLWAKSFGSTSDDYGNSISVDISGNIYTTGEFWETVDFDPGTGTNFLTSVGLSDIFVQKLDASGNFLWAKSFGSTDVDHVKSISVDTSGNVYTTGFFQGTVDFDPGVGTTNLISEGNYDIFVQKLDTSGNFLWAKSFGGVDNDYGQSINVDTSGNVYTTGDFEGNVDFDPGAGTTAHTSVGGTDIFVHKMNQTPIGILDNTYDDKLSVYPNPTNGNVTLDLGHAYETIQITITDIIGTLIYSKSIIQSQIVKIPIEKPAGVYFITVNSKDTKEVIKLIKE